MTHNVFTEVRRTFPAEGFLVALKSGPSAFMYHGINLSIRFLLHQHVFGFHISQPLFWGK